MKHLGIIITLLLFCFSAEANEWGYGIEGQVKGLYGYSSTKQHNHGVGRGRIDSYISYTFNEQRELSLHFDLMGGINQELQDYNQGRWGEEAYFIYDDVALGQIMLGQVYNVASLFHNGVSYTGAFSSNSDIVDFLHNPNWRRTSKETVFATLNSTDINTDGVAPKINYISPEIYGTAVGFSYIPDSYNRRGLISNQASFAHKDGFVGAIYNDHDWGLFSTQSSVAYADYHDNDKEFSLSLNIRRGNWNLGGGFRKTYIDGENKSRAKKDLPADFDGYREGKAWNIGLGYEIGPFSSNISYFESKASNTDNKNKIFAFSNQYSLNENIDIYMAAAYIDYSCNDVDDTGYAFVTGIGVNF